MHSLNGSRLKFEKNKKYFKIRYQDVSVSHKYPVHGRDPASRQNTYSPVDLAPECHRSFSMSHPNVSETECTRSSRWTELMRCQLNFNIQISSVDRVY